MVGAYKDSEIIGIESVVDCEAITAVVGRLEFPCTAESGTFVRFFQKDSKHGALTHIL